MKKSVVILIGIIYIASIALVGFLGIKHKVFEEVIPVERVELLNEGLEYSEQWKNYVVIRPDENGELKYQIKYRVYPDNASDQSVSFSYDTQITGVTVSPTGLVEFTEAFTGAKLVKIQIIANDGSGASATITIIARNS